MPERPSRRQRLQEQGGHLAMPPLDAAAYLWGHLLDAGLVSPGGVQAVALSWVDLQAWQQGSGLRLAPWELRALRLASRAYLAEFHAAEDPAQPAPWSPGSTAEGREEISRKVGALFSGLARRK